MPCRAAPCDALRKRATQSLRANDSRARLYASDARESDAHARPPRRDSFRCRDTPKMTPKTPRRRKRSMSCYARSARLAQQRGAIIGMIFHTASRPFDATPLTQRCCRLFRWRGRRAAGRFSAFACRHARYARCARQMRRAISPLHFAAYQTMPPAPAAVISPVFTRCQRARAAGFARLLMPLPRHDAERCLLARLCAAADSDDSDRCRYAAMSATQHAPLPPRRLAAHRRHITRVMREAAALVTRADPPHTVTHSARCRARRGAVTLPRPAPVIRRGYASASCCRCRQICR